MSKKKGGVLSTLGSILWVLFAIGILLALAAKLGVGNADDMLDKVKAKAIYYSECIPARECGLIAIIDDASPSDLVINQNINQGGNNATKPSKPVLGGTTAKPNNNSTNQNNNVDNSVDNVDNSVNDVNSANELPIANKDNYLSRETKGYRGPEKREPYVTNAGLIKKQVATNMIETLDKIKSPTKKDKKEKIKFDENEWNMWISNKDRPCWNTKEQVLSRDVKSGTGKYLDKHLEVSEVDTACTMGVLQVEDNIRTIDRENVGEWICPYTGKTITSPDELVIDHIVPLEYANENGGANWTPEKKEEFANDLENLLSISKDGKKKKDKEGIERYVPKASYRCQYAKSVTSILYKYDLPMTEQLEKNLSKAIKVCQY